MTEDADANAAPSNTGLLLVVGLGFVTCVILVTVCSVWEIGRKQAKRPASAFSDFDVDVVDGSGDELTWNDMQRPAIFSDLPDPAIDLKRKAQLFARVTNQLEDPHSDSFDMVKRSTKAAPRGMFWDIPAPSEGDVDSHASVNNDGKCDGDVRNKQLRHIHHSSNDLPCGKSPPDREFGAKFATERGPLLGMRFTSDASTRSTVSQLSNV